MKTSKEILGKTPASLGSESFRIVIGPAHLHAPKLSNLLRSNVRSVNPTAALQVKQILFTLNGQYLPPLILLLGIQAMLRKLLP